MKRIFGISLFAALLLAASMANAQEEKKIRRNQLPAAVEKTVAAESQGATIKGFSREVEKGKTYYEAEMSINGRGKDILMDTKGNIVEVEEQVDIATLPQAVQDALKQAAGNGTIEMVESLTKNGKLVAYEGHVKRGNKRSEIQVGPNGEKLMKPE
jgi:uncharacterized membrane protein YkoI